MYSWHDHSGQASILCCSTAQGQVKLELSGIEFNLRGLLHQFLRGEILRRRRGNLLRKSLDKLKALKNVYSPPGDPTGSSEPSLQGENPPQLSEEQIETAVVTLARYMQEQRDHYFALGARLDDHHKATMGRFFSASLLRKIRVARVASGHMSDPPFYAQWKAMGVRNLPQLGHLASVTFVDALVFTGPMKERDLFHGLVHAAQFDVLGVMRYSDLYARGLFHLTRAFLVPLEAQAFALDTRFATNPTEAFDVEQEVWNWASEGRYTAVPAQAQSC